MEAKFYVCRHCGNLAGMIHDAGVTMVCCGEKMEELAPNTVDASQEKHLPVVQVKDGKLHVNVGAVHHPMAEEHLIEWVYVQTKKGSMCRMLKPGDGVEITFCLGDDQAVAVYAYCNQHGLWKTNV